MIDRQFAFAMPEMPLAGHIGAVSSALQLGRNRLYARLERHCVTGLAAMLRRQNFANGAQTSEMVVHARQKHST